jgi:hypothetical protein
MEKRERHTSLGRLRKRSNYVSSLFLHSSTRSIRIREKEKEEQKRERKREAKERKSKRVTYKLWKTQKT